jgi:hypothetical protein
MAKISVENAFLSVLDAHPKISKRKLMCVVAEAVLRAVQMPKVRAWSVPIYVTHVNGLDLMPRNGSLFDMFPDDTPRRPLVTDCVLVHFTVYDSFEAKPLYDRTICMPLDIGVSNRIKLETIVRSVTV